MAIKDYSTDPDQNVKISGINIAEGCAPSGINNAIRQLMADVKEEQEARTTEDAAQDTAISNAATAAANAQSSANAAQQSANNAQTSANAAQATADRALAKDSVLPGTVIPFAGNPSSAPSGYLLCNGAAVSRTTYAALFAAIGTTYGTGDGSTTFNLPNLTDKFIQGSGTAGTVKAAGLPNITGTFAGMEVQQDATAYTGAFYRTSDEWAPKLHPGSYNVAADGHFDASRSSAIYGASTTVQPPALTMRYYIKY